MIQVKKIFTLSNELQMIKLRFKYRYHHYHYYISCVAYETFFITSIFEKDDKRVKIFDYVYNFSCKKNRYIVKFK